MYVCVCMYVHIIVDVRLSMSVCRGPREAAALCGGPAYGNDMRIYGNRICVYGSVYMAVYGSVCRMYGSVCRVYGSVCPVATQRR